MFDEKNDCGANMSFRSDWRTPIGFSWDLTPNKMIQIEYINPFVDGWDQWFSHYHEYGNQGFDRGKWKYNGQMGLLGWSLNWNLEFGDDDACNHDD